MVSTRKKKQSKRTLLSELEEFDQHIVVGNTMSDRQENVILKEDTGDQEFTVNSSGSNSAANENLVSEKML